MIRVVRRTGPRTVVTVGPVAATLIALVLALVLLALVWRAAVALVVIAVLVGVYRLIRGARRG